MNNRLTFRPDSAWLLECASLLPSSTQLIGFDIQPVHFPSPDHIPSNIELIERDVLDANIPEDLLGSFDVVHIRAFGSSVRNSDCGPLLGAVNRLLKSGGWLQWEEADTSAMKATVAGSGGDDGAQSCKTLLGVLQAGGRATGTTSDWLGDIGDQVSRAGYKYTNVAKVPLKASQYKAWTEDYLLVYEEVAQMVPREKDAPGSAMTREKYEGLFEQVVRETSRGTVIHSQHLVVVVAQKPA